LNSDLLTQLTDVVKTLLLVYIVSLQYWQVT